MVGAVSRARALLACAVVLCAGTTPAFAADLPDPTRPPQRQRAATAASAPSAEPDAPVLQSVLTGSGRTPSAIISGRLVSAGDTTHGMRLVRVHETGAVLRGPRGTVTLALTPGAEKRAAATTADAPVRTADAATGRGSKPPFPAEPK